MQPIVMSIPALAVSAIYCIWHCYALQQRQLRQHLLRERVAYMLWVMANATT